MCLKFSPCSENEVLCNSHYFKFEISAKLKNIYIIAYTLFVNNYFTLEVDSQYLAVNDNIVLEKALVSVCYGTEDLVCIFNHG